MKTVTVRKLNDPTDDDLCYCPNKQRSPCGLPAKWYSDGLGLYRQLCDYHYNLLVPKSKPRYITIDQARRLKAAGEKR